jgi:predicted AAA+ superfamily ATPase
VSVKKQLLNAKKVYGIDLGLMRQLSFQHSENQWQLLENLVFLELKKQAKTIYYHHNKLSCDFVIKEKVASPKPYKFAGRCTTTKQNNGKSMDCWMP